MYFFSLRNICCGIEVAGEQGYLLLLGVARAVAEFDGFNRPV